MATTTSTTSTASRKSRAKKWVQAELPAIESALSVAKLPEVIKKFYTVAVTFNSTSAYSKDKQYHYKTDIAGIKAGDTLVVESPTDGYVCVTVVSVHDDDLEFVSRATKNVVCKADTSYYEERKKAAKKAQTIKSILDGKIAKMQEVHKYKILEEIDPEAAELIKQLESLTTFL